MNPIRQMAKTILTALAPRGKLLTQGPRASANRPAIALTFDDGPHPDLTPRLLDRMADLNLKGTFFVVGRLAEKYPGLVRRMDEEGHELANHTYSHSEPSQTSADQFLDEVQRTDEILASITGIVPTLVRPPKGELNWSKLRGLWNANKTVVLWNVDPKDFRMKSADEMLHWLQGYQPGDGDVVLFHDIHPHALTALKGLAADGVFERFRTVTISDWLPHANAQRIPVETVNSAG